MPKKPEDIFNECLEAILAGKTVEECLRTYPDEARELRPLLETSAAIARSISSIEPGPVLKTSVMLRLDEAIRHRYEREQKRRPSLYGWQPKWATAVAAVLVILIVGGASIAASTRSQPDDLLYPVKLAAEQARLALTFSEPAKTDLRLQLAETRVNEIAYLAGKGDIAAIESVVRKLESNLGVAAEPLAVTTVNRPPDAPALTPAPAPEPRTAIQAPSPTTAPPTAPKPIAEAAPPTSSNADRPGKADDDDKARMLLSLSQAKSLAVLEEALKSATDPARPAIEQAILRIKRAYDKAINKASR
jgi:hypothetical protein